MNMGADNSQSTTTILEEVNKSASWAGDVMRTGSDILVGSAASSNRLVDWKVDQTVLSEAGKRKTRLFFFV